jgi:hypothetical protein
MNRCYFKSNSALTLNLSVRGGTFGGALVVTNGEHEVNVDSDKCAPSFLKLKHLVRSLIEVAFWIFTYSLETYN